MTREEELSRSETSEPGNVSSEKAQSRSAQRVKQLPKCQGQAPRESRKDFWAWCLAKKQGCSCLENCPLGAAVTGLECSMEEAALPALPAAEKFRIISLAPISDREGTRCSFTPCTFHGNTCTSMSLPWKSSKPAVQGKALRGLGVLTHHLAAGQGEAVQDSVMLPFSPLERLQGNRAHLAQT